MVATFEMLYKRERLPSFGALICTEREMMRKRIITNDVRYIDRHIAIVDCNIENQKSADIIKWLLKVGTNLDDETKPVREFLERCSFQLNRTLTITGIKANDLKDPNALPALGYVLTETEEEQACLTIAESFEPGSCFFGHPFGGEETRRFCVSVKSIEDVAEKLQYVARLALLALGDTRAEFVSLLESSAQESALNFYALVPVSILGDLDALTDKLNSMHYVNVIHVSQPNDNSMVTMSCFVPCKSYYRDISRSFPNDETERLKIAANVLLSVLLNLSARSMYLPDSESGLPKKSETANLLIQIAELAQSGKLVGCPYEPCGWPVVVPHASSDPYCRKSHRTRTDERRDDNYGA